MASRTILVAAVLGVVSGIALAKLPPPAPMNDEQKAAAAAKAAKAAEATKKDAELLSKSMDATAEKYKKSLAAKEKGAAAAAAPAQKK